MNRMIYRASGVVVVGFAVAAFACAGCEDKRRHQPSAAPAFATTKPAAAETATPVEVVRAFLEAVRDAQHARAGGLGTSDARREYDRAMGTIAGLAARDIIYRTMKETRSAALPVDLTPDAALTMISESWVSMAAYYVDGFDLDGLSASSAGDQPDALATVVVRAARPEDRTRLEGLEKSAALSEARGDDGKPLTKNSEPYLKKVRAVTLEGNRPFNVPIGVPFTIDLRRVGGAWRVSWMGIGPESGIVRARPGPAPLPRPTTAPAGPPQPTAGKPATPINASTQPAAPTGSTQPPVPSSAEPPPPPSTPPS
jgi:hypothetical protein